MNHSKSLLFLALLGGSGIVTYLATSRKAPEHDPKQLKVTDSVRPLIRPSRRSESTAPLPLDKRKIERMDATNYEVTVSDIAINDVGRKIERESRERLRQLTNRYQLTANQRREAFPLLVSYHADYTEGLIVNGFTALPPRANQLTSELYLIMDLFQQETYQEDVLADNEWWGEIIDQLRSDLDHSLYTIDPVSPAEGDGSSVNRPDLDLDGLFGN
ncbi:MAG: hypothetical protein ACJAVK_002581 [Akkermansiaceae bacterium]|jgi:hypothetical protein